MSKVVDSLPYSHSPDMEHDFDLDVGFDIGLTKEDLLLSTLTPSSSSSSLYQLLEQPHLYRRGLPYATTTIITTTTTTTTTTTSAPSSPTVPTSSESAVDKSISGASTMGYEQHAKDQSGDLSFLRGYSLVSEGPYLFVFDDAVSLYYPIRALILFVLGFLFSLVVDHLQTQHNMVKHSSNMYQLWDTASWIPPTCGISAVLVGTVYPLGDYLWWGRRVQRSSQDWSSVMRCFGGFIGVNYAASKLPWTSSLQVSCTLALISVGLWFWFDRTFHGFMISLTVASMGTVVAYFLVLNGWYSFTRADFFGVGSWIPCILYSSSVCFGSIGRQLDVVPAAWYDSNEARIDVKSE